MTNMSASVPMLFFKGTHYELGFKMSSTFSSQVQHYYDNAEWLGQFEEFYGTSEGRSFCEGFWCVWETEFPHFLAELQGISDGSGVPMQKVKLLHLERELATKLGLFQTVMKDVPIGCTDFLINNSQETLIGHNEDWVPDMIGQDILLCAHVQEYTLPDGSTVPEEKFVVHTWPGLLPGMNSGFNQHGLFFSIDHLFPKNVVPGKVADMFLSRNLVTASSPEELANILNCDGSGAALGFCVNAGFIGERGLWNIEIAADPDSDKAKVNTLYLETSEDQEALSSQYMHFNNYERLSNDAVRLEHCVERKRTCETVKLETLKDLRAILGESGSEFPIYQRAEGDRPWCTVASVILDIGRQVMSVFRDNPSVSEPVATLPFSLLINHTQ